MDNFTNEDFGDTMYCKCEHKGRKRSLLAQLSQHQDCIEYVEFRQSFNEINSYDFLDSLEVN